MAWEWIMKFCYPLHQKYPKASSQVNLTFDISKDSLLFMILWAWNVMMSVLKTTIPSDNKGHFLSKLEDYFPLKMVKSMWILGMVDSWVTPSRCPLFFFCPARSFFASHLGPPQAELRREGIDVVFRMYRQSGGWKIIFHSKWTSETVNFLEAFVGV